MKTRIPNTKKLLYLLIFWVSHLFVITNGNVSEIISTLNKGSDEYIYYDECPKVSCASMEDKCVSTFADSSDQKVLHLSNNCGIQILF